MKKICFMMPTVFNIGGEQRVVSVLCNELKKRGYDTSLLLFDNRFDEDFNLYNLNKEISINYVSGYTNFYKRLCRKIRNYNSRYGFLKKLPDVNKMLIKSSFPIKNVIKQIDKINPNIIIGVAGEFNLLCSILKEYFPNIKMIAWQHSSFDAYFNTKGRRHYNEKDLFCKMMSNVDKYVVLTKTDMQKMMEQLNFRSTYIYNIKSFNCGKKADLNNHQFISVGRFDKVKGFDLLIEAFDIFNKNNPDNDWKLKIIGDGSEREDLEAIIKNYELENKIILPGYSKNIIEEYISSSIYVMTSRWEGFPMVLSECMEVELPIISFDIDVMKEFITNGENGILVKKYDTYLLAKAMEELSKNLELRKSIASEEKKKIEVLSSDNILKQWEKIFEEFDSNENRKVIKKY